MSMMLFLFEFGLTIAEVSLEGLLKSCFWPRPSSPKESSSILSFSKRSTCLGDAVITDSFLKGGDEMNDDLKGLLLLDNLVRSEASSDLGERGVMEANKSSSFSSTWK